MKMRTIAALGLVIASSADAAEYSKEATLLWVGSQGDRPGFTSTENKDFINFAVGPVWSANGGTQCSETTAVLPADKPMMRAIVLAAISSGAVVFVSVDDSLPIVGGACTATTIYIKAT